MISFEATDEQVLASDMLKSLASQVLRPLARACDRTGSLSADVTEALAATGLIDLALEGQPPDSQCALSNAMAIEAIAHGDASFAIAVAATLGHVTAVMRFGAHTQRAQLRERWSSGQAQAAAVLIQEPGFHFDARRPRCEVRRQGGTLAITGTKSMVPRANACDEFTVIANCEGAAVAIVVPADTAGLEVRPSSATLGLRSLELAEVVFDNVVLPEAALLGDGSTAILLANSARAAMAAILTGVSDAVADYLVPYLKDRQAHGSALARKQSVAFRLAEMTIDVRSMRWMTWQAATAIDKRRESERPARLAHLHAAEKALWITDEGVQLMGGHGYMRDNPVERWYRDVRTVAGLEGVVGL